MKFIKYLLLVFALFAFIMHFSCNDILAAEVENNASIITLYIENAKGKKPSGVRSKYKASMKLSSIMPLDEKNVVYTATSSDSNIVRCKGNKLVAVNIGVATVVIKAEVNGKLISKKTIPVEVKKNATVKDITIEGLADGFIVEAGAKIFVCLPTGSCDTDKRRFDSYSALSQGIVIKSASAEGAYYVSFTKAGAVALTIEAYQDDIYTKETAAITLYGTVVEPAADVTKVKIPEETNNEVYEIANTDIIAENFEESEDDEIYSEINEMESVSRSMRERLDELLKRAE